MKLLDPRLARHSLSDNIALIALKRFAKVENWLLTAFKRKRGEAPVTGGGLSTAPAYAPHPPNTRVKRERRMRSRNSPQQTRKAPGRPLPVATSPRSVGGRSMRRGVGSGS